MQEKKAPFQAPFIESETIESLSEKLLVVTSELAETNRQLKQIQKEREEMLANISHDLRAPITAIRSAVDYLTSGQKIDAEDYQSSLKLIDRRTKTLENLIQDMYYLFCVEDTSKELAFTVLSAVPFLEEYFYDLLSDTRFDNREMLLDIPENLDCRIKVDVQKMIRVLDNLFTNAVKYSEDGSTITFRAALIPDRDNACLKIAVQDNGFGIPADAIPHIFSRTYTVSNARTPNSSTGSGLGLSIVKAIVERHGGKVFCESIEKKGSTFSIVLPVL